MGHPTNFTAVSESERQIKLALYVFTFVLGVSGNSLVLFFLWKKKRKSVNDLLICNLSTSDLALMLLSLPINVFLLSGTSFPTLFCKIISPLMTVTFNVSIFTLTFMAVYRWRVIINSLQPEMRHRHIFGWIVGIWLMGFLLLLPLIIVAEKDQTRGCREDWKLQQSHAYTAVLFMVRSTAGNNRWRLRPDCQWIGQIEAVTNLQCARQVRLGSEAERRSSDNQNDGFDCYLICSVYSAHSNCLANIRLWV